MKIYFLASLIAPTLSLAQVPIVSPSGQTASVPSFNGARDLAVWIHPTDVSQSLIVASDQFISGVVLFQLDGGFLTQNSTPQPIAVDLRYNFPLGGQRIALIAASQRLQNGRIGTFTISTDGGAQLQDVSVLSNITNVTPGAIIAGLAMYQSPISGNYYAFITDTDGGLQEWQLFDDGTGRVNGSRVRTLSLSSAAEGCVADDLNSQLYVAEEAVGIWKFGAEPDAGSNRVLIDSTDGGHLGSRRARGISPTRSTNESPGTRTSARFKSTQASVCSRPTVWTLPASGWTPRSRRGFSLRRTQPRATRTPAPTSSWFPGE